MTDTGTSIEALAREVAEYLRAHRPDLPPLRNQAGELVGPGQQATGRLVVNPGDEIQSVWGNTTYDQTMQVFTSTADRDAQWSAPLDGARCYTLDTQSAWIRRSGAWHGMAGGLVGETTGPASLVNLAAGTAQTIVSLAVPLVAGRAYEVAAVMSITIAGQPTGMFCTLSDSMTVRPAWRPWQLPYVQNMTSGSMAAGASRIYKPTTTGTDTFSFQALINGSAGSVAAGNATIHVTDQGS
jgi:hypothetical protein